MLPIIPLILVLGSVGVSVVVWKTTGRRIYSAVEANPNTKLKYLRPDIAARLWLRRRKAKYNVFFGTRSVGISKLLKDIKWILKKTAIKTRSGILSSSSKITPVVYNYKKLTNLGNEDVVSQLEQLKLVIIDLLVLNERHYLDLLVRLDNFKQHLSQSLEREISILKTLPETIQKMNSEQSKNKKEAYAEHNAVMIYSISAFLQKQIKDFMEINNIINEISSENRYLNLILKHLPSEEHRVFSNILAMLENVKNDLSKLEDKEFVDSEQKNKIFKEIDELKTKISEAEAELAPKISELVRDLVVLSKTYFEMHGKIGAVGALVQKKNDLIKDGKDNVVSFIPEYENAHKLMRENVDSLLTNLKNQENVFLITLNTFEKIFDIFQIPIEALKKANELLVKGWVAKKLKTVKKVFRKPVQVPGKVMKKIVKLGKNLAAEQKKIDEEIGETKNQELGAVKAEEDVQKTEKQIWEEFKKKLEEKTKKLEELVSNRFDTGIANETIIENYQNTKKTMETSEELIQKAPSDVKTAYEECKKTIAEFEKAFEVPLKKYGLI